MSKRRVETSSYLTSILHLILHGYVSDGQRNERVLTTCL